ncbi:MAG: flagellar FliJ family protein [Planctomycetaceae bacterium]
MKRFRSPLEKIQRIQQQQLRLAELHLARAQASVREADEVANQLKKQHNDVEQNIVNRLATGSHQIHPELMRSMRAHLESCGVEIDRQAARRRELETAASQVQTRYREQKAGCDGVSQLVQRKRSEHRRQALLKEQVDLDEAAMMRAHPRRHEESSLSAGSDQVTHGVTE